MNDNDNGEVTAGRVRALLAQDGLNLLPTIEPAFALRDKKYLGGTLVIELCRHHAALLSIEAVLLDDAPWQQWPLLLQIINAFHNEHRWPTLVLDTAEHQVQAQYFAPARAGLTDAQLQDTIDCGTYAVTQAATAFAAAYRALNNDTVTHQYHDVDLDVPHAET